MIKERILAAGELLSTTEISVAKFEAVRKLITGVNPKIDRILEQASKNLSKIRNFQEGNVISLSFEELPEETEEQKKRKKFIILFLKNWQDLKSEVELVNGEFGQNQPTNFGRVFAKLRGPFGLVTLAAVVIVVGSQFLNKPAVVTLQKIKVKVIVFGGKNIPLENVYVGTGTDCDSPHYHAKDHVSVIALDDTKVFDPGGCGFGKVKDTAILEVDQ